MIFDDIYIDNAIKFEHSEVINSVVVDNNAVGSSSDTAKRTLPFTPSNSNSVFVSKTGNDGGILASHVTTMTSPTGVNGILTSNGGELTGKEPWRLFDDADSSYYEGILYNANNWFMYQFNTAKRVSQYTVQMPTVDMGATKPAAGKLWGSNDGTNFTELSSFFGSSWTQGQLRTFYLATEVSYIYYKVTLTGSSSWRTGIGSFQLYGESIENIGSIETPCLTIKKAISLTTSEKPNVVINDNGIYEESGLNILVAGNCLSINANNGYAPTVKAPDVLETLDLVATNSDYRSNLNATNLPTDASSQQILLSNGNYAIVYMEEGSVRCKIYNSTLTTVLYNTILFTGNMRIGYFNATSTYVPAAAMTDFFVFSGDNIDTYRANRVVVSNDGTLISNTDIYGVYNTTYTYGYQECIKDNLWYGIRLNTADSLGLLEVYNGQTLVYTIDDNFPHYLFTEGNYAYFYITTGVYGVNTWRKLNLTTFESTTIAASGTAPLPASSTLFKFKIFKCGGRYFVLAINNIYTIDINTLATSDSYSISTVVSSATYKTVSTIEAKMAKQLNDNCILVSWLEGTDMIFTVLDLSKLGTVTSPFYSQTCVPNFNVTTCNTKIFALNPDNYQLVLNDAGHQLQIFNVSMISSAKSLTLNGIDFDANNKAYLRNGIKPTSNITIKFCSLKNMYYKVNAIDYFLSYALPSTNACIINNCKFIDGSFGIDITSNTVDFKYNIVTQFREGNGVKITGAGSGIVINHNTIHDNYSGIELVSNNGAEVVKNNIIHYNSVFGVKVATTLSITNSCCTDYLFVATLHSSSNKYNPLFKNDGFINPLLLNLHLQTNAEGYLVNSPALNIADDGKDAGCYDTTLILQEPTYTTFVIPKPMKMPMTLIPVGEVFSTMQDGSVDRKVDSYQLQIDLEYPSVKKLYVNDLLKMITAKGEVRIYFNPYTNPSLFETYCLKDKDLLFSNDLYSLAVYGFKDLKLTFVRKFDIEELN